MTPAASPVSDFYRAVWRWHFYAGLLVLPTLALLAITGGLYLFDEELNGVLYPRLERVEPRPAATAPSAWVAAAERGARGRVVRIIAPARPDQSAQLVVARPDGARRTAFVDPHEARFLGDIGEGGAAQIIKRLHSLDLAGPAANLLVEVVAGWAIVLVATGVFLWWPRRRGGGVLTVRGTPRKRLFWRDLHAVTGALAGVFVMFLAATGMPWSAVWGEGVQRLTSDVGLGRPAPPTLASTGRHEGHGAERGAVPWALEGAAPGHGGRPHLLGVDEIVRRVDAIGLPRPYTLSLPRSPASVWTAAYMPDVVEQTRTVYLDPADGRVLADVRYGQFGAAAQVIEWGISVHQGRQFGPANQLLMLAACLAILLLCVSASTMWWKRRPRGGLGVPPAPTDRRVYAGLLWIMVPLGVLYPLTGATMLLAFGADWLWRKARPARTAAPAPA